MSRARHNNQQHRVTGALMLCDGIFTHIIEGPRATVTQLQKNLDEDDRHTALEPLAFEEATRRYFSQWIMAFALTSSEGRNVVGGTFDIGRAATHFHRGTRYCGYVSDLFLACLGRIREIQRATYVPASSASYR
jgi:hypothetical protein